MGRSKYGDIVIATRPYRLTETKRVVMAVASDSRGTLKVWRHCYCNKAILYFVKNIARRES